MAENIAKNKRVLVTKVKHPGTKKQPFLQPSLQRGRKILVSQVSKVIRTGAVTNRVSLFARLRKAVRTAAFATQAKAKQLTPVDTGTLKNSINVRQKDAFTYTIGTNIKYARFVEEGTRPHVIVPRRKKALCFRGKRRGGARGRGRR